MKHKWLLFSRPFLVSTWGKSTFQVEGNKAILILPAIFGGKEISKEMGTWRTLKRGGPLETQGFNPLTWPGDHPNCSTEGWWVFLPLRDSLLESPFHSSPFLSSWRWGEGEGYGGGFTGRKTKLSGQIGKVLDSLIFFQWMCMEYLLKARHSSMCSWYIKDWNRWSHCFLELSFWWGRYTLNNERNNT